MLAIARERLPELSIHHGDMCDFQLDTKFDAVLCLFSSIAYTKTLERMEQAVANMAGHVNPSGMLLMEGWVTPESWIVGKVRTEIYETDDGFVARMALMEPIERGRLVLEYMIGDSSGISHVTETHEMGWFTHDEYMNAFKKANLTTEYIEEGLTGRGIYIGQKP
jgi:hypothetical protein